MPEAQQTASSTGKITAINETRNAA